MQQIAVAQNGLHWRDPRRSAQHEEAVVARLFGQLAGIDLEGGAGVAAREPVACQTRYATASAAHTLHCRNGLGWTAYNGCNNNVSTKLEGKQDLLIDRERLIKLLGLLGSDHNGEIAAAGRMADALIRDAGVTWADLIAPETVQGELIDALRAENEELREKVHRLSVQKNELAQATRVTVYLRRRRVKRFAALIIALLIAFVGFWLVSELFE